MRKFMLGMLVLLGIASSVPAQAQFVVVRPRPIVPVYPVYPVYPVVPVVPVVPVRPCVTRLVPVTTTQLVWTGFGYQYQTVTTYVYKTICY